MRRAVKIYHPVTDAYGELDRSDANSRIIRLTQIDMSGAVSGTDYNNMTTATNTFRGITVRSVAFNILAAGKSRITGYSIDNSQNILPRYFVKYNADANRYDIMDCTDQYDPVEIGVKPDDFDEKWKYKYFTRYTTTITISGVSRSIRCLRAIAATGATPPASEDVPAWSATTQYYKPKPGYEATNVWVTDRQLCFGASNISENRGITTRYDNFWVTLNKIGRNPGNYTPDSSTDVSYNQQRSSIGFARWNPSGTGTKMSDYMMYAINSYVPIAKKWSRYSHPFTANADTTDSGFCTLCSFDFNDVSYVGVCYISLDANGVATGAHVIAIEDPEDQSVSPWGIEPPLPPSGGAYDQGAVPGDPSGIGGTGNGIPGGDQVQNDVTKPGIFPVGAGLHLYVVTNAQFASLSDYLWGKISTVFDPGGLWAKWQNYKFNPIAGVLSLHHVPSNFMPTGNPGALEIAGTTFPEIQPMVIGDQWVKYSFTAVDFSEPIHYFADYAGVSASIYLPFCGTTNIPVSSFMGGSLQVDYWCDIVTGNVCATVTATDRDGVSQVIANCTGNCAYVLPVTGNDSGMSKIVGTLENAALSALSANPMGIAAAGIQLALGTEQHHTTVSGSMSGNSGYAAPQKIILTIEYPVNIQSPDEYNSIIGRPSAAGGVVGDYAGYAEFVIDGAEITEATTIEQDEIENALRSGVFV